jgi:hypothetical protein
MNEADILACIANDPWRMEILEVVKQQELPDWWIGAGFVRNAVWDALHGYSARTPLNDVDVVYFRSLDEYGMEESALSHALETEQPNPVWEEERKAEDSLALALPAVKFELKNQARMHLWSKREHQRERYKNATEGIADWTETATAVGVRLNEMNGLELFAPHKEDLVLGIVRPTRPEFEERVRARAESKGWFTKWPQLHFEKSV